MYTSSAMPAGRVIAVIAAVAIVVCFFLPWITAPILFITVQATGSGLASFRPLLWFTPLAAAGIVVTAVLAQIPGSSLSRSAGILIIMGAILALLPPVALFLELTSAEFSLESLLGVGFWGTIIACVAALIGGIMDISAIGGLTQPPPIPTPVPPVTPTAPAPTPMPSPRPVAVRPERTRYLGEQPPAMAWLAIKSGQRVGQQFGLQAVTRIGRSGEGEITLQDDGVSWNHARINLEGGQFYIYDLASTNGTYVNNRRVQKQLLYDNDQITLGHTTFIFKRA